MALSGMRGLSVFISDVRNCQNKEQERVRVDKELANIRTRFKNQRVLLLLSLSNTLLPIPCRFLFAFFPFWKLDPVSGNDQILSSTSASAAAPRKRERESQPLQVRPKEEEENNTYLLIVFFCSLVRSPPRPSKWMMRWRESL